MSRVSAMDDRGEVFLLSTYRAVARVLDGVALAFIYLAGAILIFMMLSTSYDTIARYFFRAPTEWSVELNAAMLIFLGFLPAGYLARADRHIQMDILFNRLSGRGRKRIMVFLVLLGFLFSVLLFWLGLRTARIVFVGHIYAAGAFRLPMWIPYGIIPVGSFLMAVAYLFQLIDIFLGDSTAEPGPS